MRKLISLIVLLGIFSVYVFTKSSSEMGYSEIVFPKTEELKGSVVPLDSVLFRYPYRFRVNEDRVVIEDLHGVDHFFHLFTYPDFRYLSSFGQRGQGPEEMKTVDDCRWRGNSFWGLDNIKSELIRWDFDEGRNRMIRKETVKLDKATFRAFDFVFYRNNSVFKKEIAYVEKFDMAIFGIKFQNPIIIIGNISIKDIWTYLLKPTVIRIDKT